MVGTKGNKMAHHSSSSLPESIRKLLGETGKYPEGKVCKEDEGEIKVAVCSKPGTVFIDFGKAITWIGFTPAQAKELAEALIKHSKEALLSRKEE
jgi:hypothetical protein